MTELDDKLKDREELRRRAELLKKQIRQLERELHTIQIEIGIIEESLTS